MDCRKSTCLYYDETMTDRCARFEPPKVEGCTFRMGLREQNEQLRAEVERLMAFVVDARDNWDCDTTGHEEFGTHRPAQCRRCQAAKLLSGEAVPWAEAVRG